MKITADRKHMLAVSFDGVVTRIEVEKIIPSSEDDISETYFRTIRFTTHTGEILEVFCNSESEKELELVEVDQLGPVRRVRTKTDVIFCAFPAKPRPSSCGEPWSVLGHCHRVDLLHGAWPAVFAGTGVGVQVAGHVHLPALGQLAGLGALL